MQIRVSKLAKEKLSSLPGRAGAELLANLYGFAHRAKSARDIAEYLAEREGMERIIGAAFYEVEYISSSDGFLLYYLNVGATYKPTLTVQRNRNNFCVTVGFFSWGDWVEAKMRRGVRV